MIINFVSGNPGKVRELSNILNKFINNIELRQLNIDLPEYQGDPEYIVREKLKEAKNRSKDIEGAILVEDTSLLFNAYKGLPGPYIKYFLKAIGPEGLYKMITPFEDHSAIAQCIIGLKINDNEPMLFIGRTEGEIVSPRGNNNFGWDPCFKPNEHYKTYAELDEDTKNELSHRSKATKLMIDYLLEK